jgi:hypothetical protein
MKPFNAMAVGFVGLVLVCTWWMWIIPAVLLLGVLLGVLYKLWWVILLVGLFWLGARAWARGEQRDREIAARADREDQAFLRGDEKLGMYGQYPPAELPEITNTPLANQLKGFKKFIERRQPPTTRGKQ